MWQFIDIDIKVDKRALIPRPETEILAQAVFQVANNPTARVFLTSRHWVPIWALLPPILYF